MKNASCLETTLPPIQFRHLGPPLYQQLADQLRQAILDKSLHPGEKLPTLQQMASLCGVARVTARQAVQLLVSEGYLEARQGRGTHGPSNCPCVPVPICGLPGAPLSNVSKAPAWSCWPRTK